MRTSSTSAARHRDRDDHARPLRSATSAFADPGYVGPIRCSMSASVRCSSATRRRQAFVGRERTEPRDKVGGDIHDPSRESRDADLQRLGVVLDAGVEDLEGGSLRVRDARRHPREVVTGLFEEREAARACERRDRGVGQHPVIRERALVHAERDIRERRRHRLGELHQPGVVILRGKHGRGDQHHDVGPRRDEARRLGDDLRARSRRRRRIRDRHSPRGPETDRATSTVPRATARTSPPTVRPGRARRRRGR